MYLYSINYGNIFILSEQKIETLTICIFFINQSTMIKNVIKILVFYSALYF